ncbi:alpha/beta fold hydrolase [Jeotgalibacillus proteolyticus]|uniref:AB hydrolase-1 domain-containing protein n=1 Tax=Jeotgalibacillus proteolyticus TaxID=2082395 RepID=A0A2S5G6X8_9BACL|nr:alpha/beta hydrolase [Jeotgalibacillus proteolyticus]PPA68703.1 hypothetical protein C4B60_19225 [Jeotgalibacillus proteolyticus]PPA68780.1 hypothetical protein C4B60_19655 [Jeotgalibacillus proteolyticus]
MENNYKLHMEKHGKGEKYLFLPGVVGTINYWIESLKPYFSKGEFIFVDPLGFGRSPKPNIIYTVDEHINAIYQRIKLEGPFVLVGHSMGGILALKLASRYPDLVKKVIVIGLPVFSDENEAKVYFRSRMRGSITYNYLAALSCLFSRGILSGISPLLKKRKKFSPLWSPTMIDEMLMHTWKSFTSSLWEVVYRGDVKKISEQVDSKIPIVCLHGTNDKTAPVSNLHSLMNLHKEWEIFTVTGGDHHIFLHHTSWCMRYILQEE